MYLWCEPPVFRSGDLAYPARTLRFVLRGSTGLVAAFSMTLLNLVLSVTLRMTGHIST
jgi:hypothetical protein